MKYEIKGYKGKTVLVIKENLVTDPAARVFKEAITTLIEDGKKDIVIDFHEVAYIGSSGIGKLLLAYKRQDDKGGAISIVGLNKDLRDLFETFQINKFFKFYNDLQDII